jgi:CubicO group peptidase (beta-lactamase class C family)
VLPIVVVLVITSALRVLYERPDRLIRIASGSVSQTLCTKTFVSGLDPAEIYAQDLRPEAGMGLIDWGLRYDIDHARKQARTTVFGLFESRAIYREGFGCALQFAATPAVATGDPPTKTDNAPSLLPDIAGPEPVVAIDPALTRVLDQAFAEYPSGPRRWTQAVVIVHGGRVIAERYAPGYSVDMPLLSHSIAKSVINALVGILVGQGKLSVSGSVPALSWHQEHGDPRANVTIDELLRMDSGLPLDEGVGPGLAQQMWFTEGDTAAFAEHAQLATAPGTAWAYSNLGYALLSRAVRDAIGGTPDEIAAFAQRELFARLGMRHALIEFDSAGTPSGSNAMFATARDWARFGMLHLNDGMVGGHRLLPEGWVVYSTRPTLNTGYGAGFWLNNVSTPIPTWGAPWGMPGVPRDTFFGRGYLGQYLVIVPSETLVVVRFGVSHISGGDIKGIGALEHDVIAALHAGAASR